MAKPRGSDMPQKQSPKGPLRLRTSGSDSDLLHPSRPSVDRSPKLGDRRSPRSPFADRKSGSHRIADLESQIGQAQEELRKLKDHFSQSSKFGRKGKPEKTQQKPVRSPKTSATARSSVPSPTQEKHHSDSDNSSETDVFEVPIVPFSDSNQQLTIDPSPVTLKITELKDKLAEKEKELENVTNENDQLKLRLAEVTEDAEIKAKEAKAKEDETTLKLYRMEEELSEIKTESAKIAEKLETSEENRLVLEEEMKTLRVQTEQWKKAADAAVSVISGAPDKKTEGRTEISGEDCEDATLKEKKRVGIGGGIRVWGDLLKKKVHK